MDGSTVHYTNGQSAYLPAFGRGLSFLTYAGAISILKLATLSSFGSARKIFLSGGSFGAWRPMEVVIYDIWVLAVVTGILTEGRSSSVIKPLFYRFWRFPL